MGYWHGAFRRASVNSLTGLGHADLLKNKKGHWTGPLDGLTGRG